MGKPTCQGRKLETVWQNKSDMKMESAKIYEKRSQIQKRKQLIKEGAVSFLEFSHKNRKGKKNCHKEK